MRLRERRRLVLRSRLVGAQHAHPDGRRVQPRRGPITQKVVVGMRIALGVAWLVVVAAEMIALRSGLGYLIMDSRNAGNRYDLVIAGMAIIGVIGLLLDGLMRLLEGLKIVRWRYAH